MKRITYLGLIIALAGHCLSAIAQSSDEELEVQIHGQWLVKIDGDDKPRLLDVQAMSPCASGICSLTANFGPANGNLRAVKAELRGDQKRWQLFVETPNNASILADLGNEENLPGTLTNKGGVVKNVILQKQMVARLWLNQNAVRALFLDKRITLKRLSDNMQLYWQVQSDGQLYAQNSARGTDSAQWTFNDKDGFCLTWRGNSGNSCEFFYREKEGGPIVSVSRKNLSSKPRMEVIDVK